MRMTLPSQRWAGRRQDAMMTAEECRARADVLEGSAEACGDATLTLQLNASARDWRRLGDVADWQDSIVAALAARGGGRAS